MTSEGIVGTMARWSQGSEMALDATVRQRLTSVLRSVDEHDTRGPRLLDDAHRLWKRVQRFLAMHLIAADADADALELSCHALQLPLRSVRLLPSGRLGRTNLRDRAEQAAELLVSLFGEHVELDEARLLADAVNLEDFGLIGMIIQAIQLARQGGGLTQVMEGCEKREQYGYWEARLKDGFHFPQVRQIAIRRLETARQMCRMLAGEVGEDG